MSAEALAQELKDTFLEDMERTGGDVDVCIRWLRNNAVRSFRQAEAAARNELEQKLWAVIDPNSVPSDIVQAVSTLAQAYRARKTPAAETAGAGGGDRRGCDDQV